MSYPAFDAFGRSPLACRHAAWRVYMALQPPRLAFHEPRSVKVLWLARDLAMGRRHVTDALEQLIAHGYIIQHSRDPHGIRSLLLAHAVELADPKGDTKAQRVA